MEGTRLRHARNIFVFLSFVIALFFLTRTAGIAGTVEGLNWLEAQVKPNGSIATVDDVATDYQSTAEALRAYAALAISAAGIIDSRQEIRAAQQLLKLCSRILYR